MTRDRTSTSGTRRSCASSPAGAASLAIGQKSGVAYGMDPDKKGAVIRQYRAGQGSALGGIEWGSAADERVM